MAVDIVIGFDNLALVLAAGLLLTYGFLLPESGVRPVDAAATRRLFLRLFTLAVVALWLTSLAWLWTRTAAMSGQPAWTALSVVPTVLFRTHFGAVWWLRLIALVWTSIAVPFVWRNGKCWRWPAMAALMLGLACIAASRSAAGHAAANGDWTLREIMDWLHWLSIATWGGSLIGALVLIFPRLHHVPAAQRARFASRFSLLASGALAGVLITGIYAAWHMLPAPAALWSSHYGRLLALKLLFVAGMMALGALNHYRLVPAMQSASDVRQRAGARGLCASVLLESVLLLVVLGVTAVLLGAMPPHG